MRKLFVLFLLITLSCITLVACTQKSVNEKVRVGEVTHSLFYTPLYVAINNGYFREEGIDLELQMTAGGDKTMTAILSNSIDIGLVGSETSIYVYNQGAKDPVINFAQLTQTDGTFLVSRTKTDTFHWSDLKGKTFLGQRQGGMPQMVGEFVLKNHNLNPQKDLTLIQNIDFANIANAFASGTGDYVQLFEPTASIFEQAGKGYIVASFGAESGNVPYTSFMTKKSYLVSHKATIEKFTKALYRGQQWVYTHTAEEITNIVQSQFSDTPKEIIIKVIQRYKDQQSFATNPLLDETEWNNLQKIMKEAGQLPNKVDYPSLVDREIAEKVIRK